ncbi:phosphatase PAP2 family protein [Microbacterium sp.]|uniref:phosphatase PAP2 family protein n=1 Tax=Microbacterium sp. TaxID=51671 RepID=UPI0039E47FD4
MDRNRRIAPVTLRIAGLVAGLLLVGAAAGIGAWVVAAGAPPAVDRWWNGVAVGAPEPLVTLALAMNLLGGGWLGVYAVPIGATLALIMVRRTWGGACFLLASMLSAVIVQFAKHAFGRARPEDMLVVSDYGSFPSGHTANAATIAVVLFVLFPRVWVAVAGAAWMIAMGLSRTILHAHWLSDTVGGALIGAGAALLVAVALAGPLGRERAALAR